MTDRQSGLLDRCLAEVDNALRVLLAPARAGRPSPAAGAEEGPADPAARRQSEALMRVDHAGEIAAQALYRGQAFVCRNPPLRDALLAAAGEEQDHLAWCEERIRNLGGRTSLFAPFWYAGSFAIGTAAGLAGDETSLGFLAETERQVAEHLDGHLERLPPDDLASRRIVGAMREEELAHSLAAVRRGGGALPRPVRLAMRLAAKVMTTTAARL